MGRRSRKAERYAEVRGRTDARERLERYWFPRLREEPRWAKWVTAGTHSLEPFHRWFSLRQGFSPELVRVFLQEVGGELSEDRPLLDPFSGSGTTVTEAARNAVPAAGVEASEVLVFLANARSARSFPPLPDIAGLVAWSEIAPRLDEDIHRAALLCAVAASLTSEGRPKRSANNLAQRFMETAAIIEEDLHRPLPIINVVTAGDARRLSQVADGSISAVLTSPPYLSRYDYPSIVRGLNEVYRSWFSENAQECDQLEPVRAVAKGQRGDRRRMSDVRGLAIAAPKDPVRLEGNAAPVTQECAEALRAAGEHRLAETVTDYFSDVQEVFRALRRVVSPGAPCWLVIGGARLKDVYVPSDLILAEIAQAEGFVVESIVAARRLIESGRKLGSLHDVSPRESVLRLRAH